MPSYLYPPPDSPPPGFDHDPDVAEPDRDIYVVRTLVDEHLSESEVDPMVDWSRFGAPSFVEENPSDSGRDPGTTAPGKPGSGSRLETATVAGGRHSPSTAHVVARSRFPEDCQEERPQTLFPVEGQTVDFVSDPTPADREGTGSDLALTRTSDSSSRLKSSRSRASGFRESGELRPLYIVSHNAEIGEADEQLPGLPSGGSRSRATSVHGNED